jgi:putative SOS response-associated peptidase YedK
MCGRFTLTERDLIGLARGLGAALDAELAAAWRPRFNVAPGQDALLVREAGGPRLVRARFGLPRGDGPLHFNARVETAAEKRAFRAAWGTRRCAVPADGFYEWEGPPRARRPIWFHDPARRPLLFAALFGEEDGQLGFAILTAPATGPVAAFHDRMPVLLPEGALQDWLAGGPPPPPSPAGALVGAPASPRVNLVANDDEGCLEPPRERQLGLL